MLWQGGEGATGYQKKTTVFGCVPQKTVVEADTLFFTRLDSVRFGSIQFG
jgi:hypothetical protein